MTRKTEQLTVGRRRIAVSNLDIGTYELIEGNFYKGFLRFYLKGTMLKGEWTIKRFRDAKNESDNRDKWHLIKTGGNTRAYRSNATTNQR